jgi:uncharacterized protein (DUF736 family)
MSEWRQCRVNHRNFCTHQRRRMDRHYPYANDRRESALRAQRQQRQRPGSRVPVFVDRSELDHARCERTSGEKPRDHLRVRRDDPSLAKPLLAAVFQAGVGKNTQLIWNRR